MGGNGLGLAICGAIAKANQWVVTLDQTGEGVLATIMFANHRADADGGEARSRKAV